MKFILLAISALIPTWFDYATYNSRFTAFYYDYYSAKIDCIYPGEDGKSLCLGKELNTILIMNCAVDRYAVCDAWEKKLNPKE